MLTEQQVIAVVSTQPNILGESPVPTVASLQELIASIESTGNVDLVVVSSTDQALLQAAAQLDAVNHHFDCIGQGVTAKADLVATLIDGVETFIDEDAWVLLVDPTASNSHVAQLIAQAFQVVAVNPDATGVHTDHACNLMLFKAGAFVQSKSLPVQGSIEFLSH